MREIESQNDKLKNLIKNEKKSLDVDLQTSV